MHVAKTRELTAKFVSAIKSNSLSSSLSSAGNGAPKNFLTSPVITSRRFSLCRSFVKNSNEGDSVKGVKEDLPFSIFNLGASFGPGESNSLSINGINSLCASLSRASDDSEDSYLPEGTDYSEKSMKNLEDDQWLKNMAPSDMSIFRKDITLERKKKYAFKSTQGDHLKKTVKLCRSELGPDYVFDVFGKLGQAQEIDVEECNALVKELVASAEASEDENFASKQMTKACHIFNKMLEQGFLIEEETYWPILMYLIERGMVEEFHAFSGVIRECNLCSVSRLAYYEMLLWLAIKNEEKIKELLNDVAVNDGKENYELQESYIVALCDYDKKEELVQLLELIDITKLSLTDCVTHVFKSLGRWQLEPYTEKLLSALQGSGCDAKMITNLIITYFTGHLDSKVEDVAVRFKELHKKLDISPSSSSYVKLIRYACESLKVHVALDLLNELCELDLNFSSNVLNIILQAAHDCHEYNLVGKAYSLISCHNRLANDETYRIVITLLVKKKDFAGAYKVLDDMNKSNSIPTSKVYNVIMGGYFREKNICGALTIFEKMKKSGVKPDVLTYSYLINNSKTEEDIARYHEELQHSGLQITKRVYMAFINAYAACGQFEKAKQVVADEAIPVNSLYEIKSVLVSALASNGRVSEALDVHEEVKQTGNYLDPKAIISLLNYARSESEKPTKEEMQKMIVLLQELHGSEYWIDGCLRTILYCVRNKYIRLACDLFKQLKDNLRSEEIRMEVFFDEVFCLIGESESSLLESGKILLQFMKKQLQVMPSRKSLDFLLDACIKVKDIKSARLIWKEYEVAGLVYNGISFLRMYQVLLASGDRKAAKIMLARIPKDDPHVRLIIKACQKTYNRPKKNKAKKQELRKR